MSPPHLFAKVGRLIIEASTDGAELAGHGQGTQGCWHTIKTIFPDNSAFYRFQEQLMRDASSLHISGEHSFLVDDTIGDLDLDLVRSLIALNSAENLNDETSLPTGSIILTAAGWFVAGIVLWALVGFYI
ncbi:hypothetical protein [Pseudomonas frederiksbergensis]|uniref:hypothetical protein n=1 Tax=Pseudomonas frederiksbergensis TaxID=104087 RepID=UPI003D191836